jgi:ammonium transporter, Amt family
VTETALADDSIASQVWIQRQGVLVTIALSGAVSLVAVVECKIGSRVNE